MVAFTFTTAAASLATLASLANALPAAGAPALFKLSTCAQDPSSPFSGLYLTVIHTGAGEDAVVTTSKKHQAVTFQFNGTYITEPLTSSDVPAFNLHLDNYRPTGPGKKGTGSAQNTAPKGYYYIDLGVDGRTSGFHAEGRDQAISYKGKEDFGSFALCEVSGVAQYSGKTVQLLYSSSDATANAGKCEDVTLYALFQDPATGKIPDAKVC